MNLKISNYLHHYIQEKYPMYYEAITKKDFMSFVNAIASNPLFNKYSVDTIESGAKNDIIDKLVDQYARIQVYDVWENNVCQNLKSYVLENFPMYCKFLDDSQLSLLLKSVVENDAFVNKKYGIPEILSGEVNELVDELVEQYVQLKLTDIWANYENLCNHIKKLIIDSKNDKLFDDVNQELCLNERTLDSIVEKMANVFIQGSEKQINYMNRSYDQIFLINFDSFFDGIKEECRDYIEKYVDKAEINISNVIVREYLLDRVMNVILFEYDITDILSGEYDDKIVISYKECFNTMKEEVISFIKHYLVENIDFGDMLGISEDKIIAHFINDNNFEESFIRMSSGKFGDDIRKYVMVEKKNALEGDNKTDRIEVVPSTLMTYDSDMRKENSVKSSKPNVPDRVKYNSRKRKMRKSLFTLLLVGTVTAASLGVGKVVYNRVDDFVGDVKYSSAVRQFEQFGVADSDMIFTVHSDQYEEAVDNVIDFYTFCKRLGLNNPTEFCLGFNLVRNQVRSEDTLSVMDKLLDSVKSKVNSVSGMEDLKNAINDDTCFLSFAYDLLLEMDCDEIKKDKYYKLVTDYANAMNIANGNPETTAYDYLSESNKKLASKMMDLYWEYSKDCAVELGNKINDNMYVGDFAILLSSVYNDNNNGNIRR